MPPKGWRKEDRDMSHSPLPTWHKGFTPFGDRLNFLSPERQHLATGRLRIAPPRGDKPSVRPDKVS